MKGDAKVIDYLNEYLQIELTGHKQYMLAAAMCANWGYRRLQDKQEEYSREETTHAARIAQRIFFLEGLPKVSDARAVAPIDSVEAQIKKDQELVRHAIARLREAVDYCIKQADGGTRQLFEEMLVDEESHLDWLEAELTLMDQVGLQNYLAEQIRS